MISMRGEVGKDIYIERKFCGIFGGAGELGRESFVVLWARVFMR